MGQRAVEETHSRGGLQGDTDAKGIDRFLVALTLVGTDSLVVIGPEALGFQVEGGAPERLADLMRSESRKWGQVVKDANVKVD